jgi:hypothetical protein
MRELGPGFEVLRLGLGSGPLIMRLRTAEVANTATPL